jgi:hypothetical protein
MTDDERSFLHLRHAVWSGQLGLVYMRKKNNPGETVPVVVITSRPTSDLEAEPHRVVPIGVLMPADKILAQLDAPSDVAALSTPPKELEDWLLSYLDHPRHD